ncbi:hypothetical protein N7466_002079 [Penicillium verhagenii]|uniref:uncharacterized protein n=1 Tax=Penicillium verhagenii TaxID=1562060 RepID=UPI002545A069|nr:uncharacterized protein N7466_002079 [Penicillium verhagenii]KAJ5938945.1 hypothetical protein N7466_002079 [Penicillium verhagenii]
MFQILTAAFRAENGKPSLKLPLDFPREPLPTSESSETALSIVHCDDVAPAIVAKSSLSDRIKHPQVLPGAMSYRLLNSINDIEDTHLKKHMRKGTTSIESLERLFQKCPREGSPAVTIGESAFVCSPQMADDNHSYNMSEVFNEVQLQFNNGLKSTQYFNTRLSTIKPKLLKAPSPDVFKSIHINSGMCLGSKAALAMSPGHGQGDACVIPKVPENEEPTLYELETIARLSSGIADAAALFGGCSTPHTTISISLDVPDFQYYWTVWELFKKDLVTIEYVQDWMTAIQRRRAQLQKIMASVIYKMLLDRGIGDIKVNFASSTEATVELLQERLLSGIVPSLEELLHVVQRQGSHSAQWTEFLTHLESGEQPLDGTDLGKLMYVFEAVKYALETESSRQKHANKDDPSEKLIIFLDDTAECRIFNRATKFIKRYSESTTMIGIFPLQKILAAGYGRSDLYMNDPGPVLCLERGKTRVNLFDVIRMSYGPQTATLLQLSCQEQGFRTGLPDPADEAGWPLLTPDTFKFLGACAALGAAIWFKGRLWSY